MLRPLLAFSTLALALAGQPLHAQQTQTHVYRGVVESVTGVPTPDIRVGDRVEVTYRLDTSVPDAYADNPRAGYYTRAAASVTVALPRSGFEVAGDNGGPGEVQTYDNTQLRMDELSIRTRAIVEPEQINAVPVTGIEYRIIGGPAPVGETPDMLTSDALPTHRVLGDGHYISLYTSIDLSKSTSFKIALDPDDAPTVAELVEDAVLLLDAGMKSGAIKPGVAKSLALKFERVLVAYDAGKVRKACSTLRTIDTRVRKSIRTRCMSSALARELLALTAAIRQTGGGC